ncbi:aspartyl-phosphate phosphatase Spo0E family protein [Bacillus massiliglaciei]|uniref:aspartyl-phosphate phosphatase Spo0E family protein n=1 Tax=Bacillus massiliglaciei TaxID=1816693 RepID=UPI000DA61725|nr:aspartyl-phosphate phosphatase Spo0E family protein [Bacillus massiliglaciei]
MPPKTSQQSIVRQIDSLRHQLITTGLTKGLTHPDTIKTSKELDRWLYKYQIKNSK